METSNNNIIIKGAKQHNLKNINLHIPKNKLIVFTGLSGSGKSTLAFDTIFAEGQRRYVESLSAYARQFLQIMDKPDVDVIEGLSPAIAIQQKTTNKNPRSTVGTITEIYDYFRLLFSKIGIPHCPQCNRKISHQSIDSIVNRITTEIKNIQDIDKKTATTLYILAPIVREKKGVFEKVLRDLKDEGYLRIRIDKIIINLNEFEKLDLIPEVEKQKRHSIDVVIDRIILDLDNTIERDRIFESVQNALNMGDGLMILQMDEKEHIFSQKNACPYCNINLGEMEPRFFSFNSPFGACSKCNGLGIEIEFDPELIIPDKSKSILDGGIKPWSTGQFASFRTSMLKDVGRKFGFNLNTPIEKMNEEQLNVILYGTDIKINYNYVSKSSESSWEYSGRFKGVIPNLERIYNETESESKREEITKFMKEKPCEKCNGNRLKKEVLSVKINEKSIMDICNLPIDQTIDFFNNLYLTQNETIISKQILKEIKSRLEFLLGVGLNYLNLNRKAGTLSGGESQRIRLATQIGSNLTGVLYVLDEPTIGLHQRDNALLIKTLYRLRDLGNTVIIVEHDEDIIRNSDWIIDIGPAAGVHGGQIVASGKLKHIMDNENSITGEFLSGKKKVIENFERKENNGKFISILGACENNLKNINPKFPIGLITVVTGVSGSGKSTLVNDILYNYLMNHFYKSKLTTGKYEKIQGVENIDKIIGIDQSPIGRTPRSNAITYVNAFTKIRELYSSTQDSKEKGYKPGRFSFNLPAGRCDACEGAGVRKIEMQFLPDVYITCDQCNGKRYNTETLAIKYKGKNISEVLDMTVEEALDFFKNITIIANKLKLLNDVGLGYLHLGQSATTLSGGEAQRIKLATELSKKDTGNTLYILDEPTTGLHFLDVKKLLKILYKLREMGNTIIIIEHNLDVISAADWIVDLGPEGGNNGGQIIANGPPEEIIDNEKGY
ncbi:MAG: excinuclease ABC subunit UvrA, partial [Thermoproteota archaeon]|nr:excinuclease ABC subunit UvrA [Thermoproteota archaeon]